MAPDFIQRHQIRALSLPGRLLAQGLQVRAHPGRRFGSNFLREIRAARILGPHASST